MNAFLRLVGFLRMCCTTPDLGCLLHETPRFPGQAIPLPHLAQAPGTRKGWNLGSLGAAAIRWFGSPPPFTAGSVVVRFGSTAAGLGRFGSLESGEPTALRMGAAMQKTAGARPMHRTVRNPGVLRGSEGQL